MFIDTQTKKLYYKYNKSRGDALKTYTLKRIQTLNISMEKAWDYFSSPENLAEITPDWLDFRIISEVPEKMYEGMVVKYHVHPFAGFPIGWLTEITHVEEPYFFVDEQRFGPYKLWHHQHHFAETNEGVEMTDIVTYMLPFEPFSSPLMGWYVSKKLKQIFDYRFDTLEKIFNQK
jgi:ligand-binding SRPBCC domain-containing protein